MNVREPADGHADRKALSGLRLPRLVQVLRNLSAGRAQTSERASIPRVNIHLCLEERPRLRTCSSARRTSRAR